MTPRQLLLATLSLVLLACVHGEGRRCSTEPGGPRCKARHHCDVAGGGAPQLHYGTEGKCRRDDAPPYQ